MGSALTRKAEGIMNTPEWFTLPNAQVGNADVAAEIRSWEPGDGLMCRSASYQKRIPCGAPVAVVRTKKVRRSPYSRDDVTRSTSVYCEKHVSELVRRQVGDADWIGNGSTQRSVRKAEETVIAAHFAEYQEALDRIIAEQKDKYLSLLPEWLRDGFANAEAVAS